MKQITPAQRERATKRLQSLSTKHFVRRINAQQYGVRSGRTGNCYTVSLVTKTCNCWASKHGQYCDHIAAVELVANAFTPKPQPKPRASELVPTIEYRPGGVAIRGYRTADYWEV